MTLAELADFGYDLSVPRFTVDVGGTTFEETDGLVTDVSVDATMDGADRFDMTIASRYDHESGEFVDFDWEDVPIGANVAISMGYGADDDLSTMLLGSVTEIGTRFPASGAPTISVSGYGHYHDLTTNVLQERWEDRRDDEIAEAIAGAYGLDADTRALSEDERRSVRYNDEESDAAYLEELASKNRADNRPYQVFVRRDRLRFGPPSIRADPVMELTYGESLESFSPTFSGARQLDGVVVKHWDPEKKDEIRGVAGDDDGDRVRTLKHPVSSSKEAERLAERIMNERDDESFTGSAETIGLPELDVDSTVELTGLGSRFSGIYYITEVNHTVDSSGYRTSFDVRLAEVFDP